MAQEGRPETAFRSVLGLFEYTVVPFGHKGCMPTFQDNTNACLQPLLEQGVIAYLDDLLVYISDLNTHSSLLRQVRSTFLNHQFYAKLAK